MTLAELHLTQEFLSLTDKQRAWVDALIETQNALEATRRVYGDIGNRYVALRARQIEGSRIITAVLDTFYARTPREKFIRDLERVLIHSNSGTERAGARSLYAEMVFGIGGSSKNPDGDALGSRTETPARFRVGDIVIRADKTKLRVTAVDGEGRVTEGDPIP
jgi:hypothetical protein